MCRPTSLWCSSRLLHGGVDWNKNQLRSVYAHPVSPPSRRRGLKSYSAWQSRTWQASPPSRRRGLKFLTSPILRQSHSKSPPSRRRGLKFLLLFLFETALKSPPSRRRGLKFLSPARLFQMFLSPPSRRRGLKSSKPRKNLASNQSPPSRRRGLKFDEIVGNKILSSRLLHGGVDWNFYFHTVTPLFFVASFTEAWIEINETLEAIKEMIVASFTEAWIEIFYHIRTNYS